MALLRSSGTGHLERLEMRREAALGAVEAHPASDVRAAERSGGGTQRKLLPGDEAQHFAVCLAQPREGSREDVVLRDAQERVFRRGKSRRHISRSSCPVMVREQLSCNCIEPRQRFPRHIVELAPTDKERFRDEILDRVDRHPAPDVQRDVLAMALVDLVEPAVRLPLHSPRLCRDRRECYSSPLRGGGERETEDHLAEGERVRLDARSAEGYL